MLYHIMIWPADERQQASGELYGFNLTEDQLRERVIEPYNEGSPITWGGRTLDRVDSIHIGVTEGEVHPFRLGDRYDAFKTAQDVTNDWITGPQGAATRDATRTEAPETTQPLNPRRVMVIHGRNEAARVAMFHFLRALGLQPIEWEAAIRETGMGSPHNLEAVRAAMDVAQAVAVVLTAEDQAGLLPALAETGDSETALRGQPRQNVILEAGLAMGVSRARTILVELGPIRRASDFEGLNAVRLSNAPAKRTALRSRFQGAGCDLDDAGTDWLTPESGGDFEACLISWEAIEAPAPGEEASAETEARARRAPEDTSRAEHGNARQKEFSEKLRRFLDQRRGIDQPFSEVALVAHMDDKKFDEVAALRLLRRLHEEGMVYPNPDGSGWYPREE